MSLQPFLIALQFLTILPVRLNAAITEQDIGTSILYYPLVGGVISLILLTFSLLLQSQAPLVAASLVLVAWVAITGALHLDGLADTADAWLGGLGDKAKTLLIMKDPTAGPVAVTVVVLVLLIKVVMLSTLLSEQNYMALAWSIILARTALPLLFLTTPYVRQQGLGSILKSLQPHVATRWLLLIVCVLAVLSTSLSIVLLAFLTFLLLRYLMERRLAGFTGDTAGAMVELLEAILLTFFVLL